MVKKNKIQSEVTACLQPVFKTNLKKIILYGSYARNDEVYDSDIDFLVLTDLTDPEIRKIEKEITKISTELTLKFNVVISIIIVNYSHFIKYSEILPFYKNISTEGIELYGS